MTNATRTECWLWPDRTIGKRESRQLREDHNATVNAIADSLARVAELEAALSRLVNAPDVNEDMLSPETIVAAEQARAALARSTQGGGK